MFYMIGTVSLKSVCEEERKKIDDVKHWQEKKRKKTPKHEIWFLVQRNILNSVDKENRKKKQPRSRTERLEMKTKETRSGIAAYSSLDLLLGKCAKQKECYNKLADNNC